MNYSDLEMEVSYYGTAAEFACHGDEYMASVKGSMASGQLLQGREVEKLEATIATMTGRSHAVAVNSATDALFFSLVALGIEPGDEVLVPDFSFVASASCVVRAGAVPIFVDVNADYTMDLRKARASMSPKTRAMIFVHLFGRTGVLEVVEEFAGDHGIYLVEDAAQVLGASTGGRPAGSMGNVSCFSFDPTKVISAPGSGGILTTDDGDIASSVRRLRYHGKHDNRFDILGYNSQMSSVSAGVLSVKLEYMEEWCERRRQIASQLAEGMRDLWQVSLPSDGTEALHVYHKYVIRVERRDELRAVLDKAGIQTLVHYPRPLHVHPVFSDYRRDQDYSVAIRTCRSVLSLPMHPFLSSHEVVKIVDTILGFYGSSQWA